LTANSWIDILGKDEQLALFKMIDLAIANKKMKDNLQPTPDTLKKNWLLNLVTCFTLILLPVLARVANAR
jgi:hypothetical protein